MYMASREEFDCRPHRRKATELLPEMAAPWLVRPAHKKLPERTGPRGAKDADRFRERLEASARLLCQAVASGPNRAATRQQCCRRTTFRYAKRAARILADGPRSVVRRKAFAFPVQTDTTWFTNVLLFGRRPSSALGQLPRRS